MTKLGAAFWLGLVLASGFATFKVKYAVQNIDDQLVRVRKQTVAEQQEIRVLTAEWTYLNQPERLADLNRRFLQLAPITTKQLQQRIEDIPLRPPAAAPDMVVAANAAVAAAPPAKALPEKRPPVAPAVSRGEPARPLPVQLATADAVAAPASLDALIAQIAEKP